MCRVSDEEFMLIQRILEASRLLVHDVSPCMV